MNEDLFDFVFDASSNNWIPSGNMIPGGNSVTTSGTSLVKYVGIDSANSMIASGTNLFKSASSMFSGKAAVVVGAIVGVVGLLGGVALTKGQDHSESINAASQIANAAQKGDTTAISKTIEAITGGWDSTKLMASSLFKTFQGSCEKAFTKIGGTVADSWDTVKQAAEENPTAAAAIIAIGAFGILYTFSKKHGKKS